MIYLAVTLQLTDALLQAEESPPSLSKQQRICEHQATARIYSKHQLEGTIFTQPCEAMLGGMQKLSLERKAQKSLNSTGCYEIHM
jgi:hypothetical protein